MGVDVVAEYDINEREVGYYRIGNRRFLKQANTNEEKQVLQDYIPLATATVKNAAFE
jgi:hypothetical protein